MTEQNTPDVDDDGPESVNMSVKLIPEGEVVILQVGLGLSGPALVLDADMEKTMRTGDLELRLRAGGFPGLQELYDTLELALEVLGRAEEVKVEPHEVTDDDVEAFKKAWHEVDERPAEVGRQIGRRTRAGLAAVFAARAAR